MHYKIISAPCRKGIAQVVDFTTFEHACSDMLCNGYRTSGSPFLIADKAYQAFVKCVIPDYVGMAGEIVEESGRFESDVQVVTLPFIPPKKRGRPKRVVE